MGNSYTDRILEEICWSKFEPNTDRPDQIPDERGVYIICAKHKASLPKGMDGLTYTLLNGLSVLYVGIAGRQSSKVFGLRSRDYKTHFQGTARKSTLRKSLGVLLGYKKKQYAAETGTTKYESGDGSLTHSLFCGTIFTNISIRVIVMPRQGRELSESQTYHVMVRGNERRNIFLDDEDKARFIDTLHNKKQPKKFTLHAYCLMDNHVHLLISEGTEEISKVMQRINVSYVYYFNRKYGRIGHLFQDRFKSEGIEDDTQLLAVVRYIHNNPIKANIVKHAGEYAWSSYGIYTNIHKDIRGVINKEAVLELFSPNQNRAIDLFIKYSEVENAEIFIELEKADEKSKSIQNELDAKKLIENYLNEQGFGLKEIKLKENVVCRNALIADLKGKSNLSVRQIANLLGLDRNIVQRTK